MLAESDLFEPGRAVLTATGRQRLDTIAAGFKRLKCPPSASFVIAAFTDRGPGGDEDLGRILTQEQAEAVKTYLTARHKIQSNGWFTSCARWPPSVSAAVPLMFLPPPRSRRGGSRSSCSHRRYEGVVRGQGFVGWAPPTIRAWHQRTVGSAHPTRTDPMATSSPVLVTGATGLLGSHLVERLAARGEAVRVLVRAHSNTAFLDTLNVDRVVGDLTDPAACARAVAGVEIVYHAAAKVGDWGTWKQFQTDCLDATAHLADAAVCAGVRRFVHISSTSAYGHPREGGPPVVETAPLGQHFWPIWDDYTRSKVEQERLVWDRIAGRGTALTVIRPSWLYGERDRTTTARLIARLRAGQVRLIGPGDNPLSAIYAGEVAAAAILAANDPGSAGEAYNITDQGPITQRAYFTLWAEAVGALPSRATCPITRRLPPPCFSKPPAA